MKDASKVPMSKRKLETSSPSVRPIYSHISPGKTFYSILSPDRYTGFDRREGMG